MNESLTKRALSRVDLAAFEAVRARHSYDDGPGGVTKYLALEQWIGINVRRATGAGLHEAPPRRILDIGTGCGYFPFVCRLLGHNAIAIDHPRRSSVYPEVCGLLGVDVIDHDVRPMVALPDLGKFDVISSFMVTFNGHRAAPWAIDAWRFFIADMRSRLRPGGVIVLELNREPPPLDACYTPELRAAFVDMGADITGHWPHRHAADGHRLVFR